MKARERIYAEGLAKIKQIVSAQGSDAERKALRERCAVRDWSGLDLRAVFKCFVFSAATGMPKTTAWGAGGSKKRQRLLDPDEVRAAKLRRQGQSRTPVKRVASWSLGDE